MVDGIDRKIAKCFRTSRPTHRRTTAKFCLSLSLCECWLSWLQGIVFLQAPLAASWAGFQIIIFLQRLINSSSSSLREHHRCMAAAAAAAWAHECPIWALFPYGPYTRICAPYGFHMGLHGPIQDRAKTTAENKSHIKNYGTDKSDLRGHHKLA